MMVLNITNILLQDNYEHIDIIDQKNCHLKWKHSLLHSHLLHYITCKQLRRCSPIITFETQTALEQAKRTSLFLLSFWTWLKLKCPRSSQRKEVSDSGTTSLGRSFHWNSSGQEIDGWVPPPLSSAANKVTHSHFKTYEKPDLTDQSRKLKVVLLDCSKPWEDCALPATKLRCN